MSASHTSEEVHADPSSTPASLLRRPVVAAALGLCLLGRLPTAVAPLAIVLAISGEDGSFASAGLIGAAFVAGGGVSGPWLGRMADRRSARTVILVSAAANAAAFVGLAVTVTGDPLPALAFALLAGVSQPPLEPALRARWPQLVRDGEVDAAYTLESACQEVLFVAGPALAAGLDQVSTQAPFLLCAVVVAVASPLFSRVVRAEEGVRSAAVAPVPPGAPVPDPGPGAAAATSTGSWLGLLRVPGLARAYLVIVLIGAPIGAVTVGLPGYTEEIGRDGLAGVLLAAQALGALTGGLTGMRRTTPRPLPVVLVAQALCMVPVVALPGPALTGVLAFVAGLPLARVLARISGEIEANAPRGRSTEAFGWFITAFQVGAAAATFAGGALVDLAGPRAALAIAPVSAAAAVLVARGGRRAAPKEEAGSA